MGLEIGGTSHLEYVGEHSAIEDGKFCEESGHFEIYGDAYPLHHADLKNGCYRETPQSECEGFRMSYGYYDWWREQLFYAALGVSSYKVMLAPMRVGKDPLMMLIRFTDCNGTIGPGICGMIAQAFEIHDAKVRKYAKEGIRLYRDDCDPGKEDVPTKEEILAAGKEWIEYYEMFKQVLKLGAQNGIVTFR